MEILYCYWASQTFYS